MKSSRSNKLNQMKFKREREHIIGASPELGGCREPYLTRKHRVDENLLSSHGGDRVIGALRRGKAKHRAESRALYARHAAAPRLPAFIDSTCGKVPSSTSHQIGHRHAAALPRAPENRAILSTSCIFISSGGGGGGMVPCGELRATA